MKKTTPTLSIFFYVLAVVFLLFACFYFIQCYQTISNLIESNQLGNIEFDYILSIYIGQVGPYVAYSSLLYGIGHIIAKLNELQNKQLDEEVQDASSASIEEDTFFEDVVDETVEAQSESESESSSSKEVSEKDEASL